MIRRMPSLKLAGSTLIETVFSLLICALLLLAVDSAQIASIRGAKAAFYFAIATQQVDSISQQLKSLQQGDYTNVMREWNQQLSAILPTGKGVINGSYPIYELAITWGNRNGLCSTNKIGVNGCLRYRLNLAEKKMD